MSQEKTSREEMMQEMLSLAEKLTPEQREDYLAHLRTVVNGEYTGSEASGEISQ